MCRYKLEIASVVRIKATEMEEVSKEESDLISKIRLTEEVPDPRTANNRLQVDLANEIRKGFGPDDN